MARPSLAEKDILNPSEAIEYFVLSRRKFYDLLNNADGKYQYKYHIDGKPHFVYSWKLEPTDKLPKGKKPCLSLRELESR